MNKTRLENLSDAFFAIIMTLLVIELHVPEIPPTAETKVFLEALWHNLPLFGGYFISFIVLSMFWVSHHALFHFFTKTVNRIFIQINMLYLMLLALIPFSTHLLSSYHQNTVAVIVYGLNILLISLTSLGMFLYALKSKEVETHEVSPRLMMQAKTRLTITPIFTLIGIFISFFAIPLAMFFYAFPVLFNIIPGTLDFIEKKIKFFRLG